MPKKDEIVTGTPVTYQTPNPAGGVKLETFVPYTLIKRGVKREIITPLDAPEQFREEAMAAKEKHKATKDTALVKALGLAYYWQSLLDQGKFKTLTEIADAEGIHITQVRRLLRLTLLAPKVIEWLTSTPGIKLEQIIRRPWSTIWVDQVILLHTYSDNPVSC